MSTKELASAFLHTFQPLAEYTAYVLNKDQAEALVLKPLGQFPQTAGYAAQWMATAPSSYIRCIAALVPAFTPTCDPDLLWNLWQREIKCRDNPHPSIRADLEEADANPEAFGLPLDPTELGIEPVDEPREQPPIEERVAFIATLEANSVSERILISAISFLERGPEYHGAACRVLRDMVARALNGENWQDAHFALALLVRAEEPEAAELLRRAAALEIDGHLPTWAGRIAAGERSLLDEPLKLVGPPPADVSLPEEQQEELDAMLAAARRVEESID